MEKDEIVKMAFRGAILGQEELELRLSAAYHMAWCPEVCGLEQVPVQRHVESSTVEELGIKTQVPFLSARLFPVDFLVTPFSGCKKLQCQGLMEGFSLSVSGKIPALCREILGPRRELSQYR